MMCLSLLVDDQYEYVNLKLILFAGGLLISSLILPSLVLVADLIS